MPTRVVVRRGRVGGWVVAVDTGRGVIKQEGCVQYDSHPTVTSWPVLSASHFLSEVIKSLMSHVTSQDWEQDWPVQCTFLEMQQ